MAILLTVHLKRSHSLVSNQQHRLTRFVNTPIKEQSHSQHRLPNIKHSPVKTSTNHLQVIKHVYLIYIAGPGCQNNSKALQVSCYRNPGQAAKVTTKYVNIVAFRAQLSRTHSTSKMTNNIVASPGDHPLTHFTHRA